MSDDLYEREHLGSGEAIHRERSSSRATFRLLGGMSGLLGLFSMGALAAGFSGDPQGFGGAILMGGLALVVAAAAVLGTVMRIVVTRTELRVQVGLVEQRVPLASITQLSVVPFGEAATRFRAIRRGAQFFAPSKGERVVVLEWTDADGKARTTFVANDQPEVLVDVLERARGAGPRVRVAADAGTPDDTAAEPAELAERAHEEAPRARR
jgi:hypothetical protein